MRVGLLAVVTAVVCVPSVAGAQIVISEVYGGGGGTNAQYNQDFVELYNNSSTPRPLGVLYLQYASASGTSYSAFALKGSLAPGAVVLVAFGPIGPTGSSLPDTVTVISGPTNVPFNATNGKVALTSSSTVTTTDGTVTPGTPPYANVIDFVGYGTANQYEGTAAAPAGSNTTSLQRKIATGGGLQDTNVNSADFLTGAPTPGVAAVPEPGSLLLVGATCLSVLGWRSRRRTKSAAESRTA